MSSMTAFAAVAFPVDSLGQFQMEIQSVNRKNLDMAIFLPKEFSSLDFYIRKAIQKVAFRGHVTVKVFRQALVEDKMDLFAIKQEIDALAKACFLTSVTSIEGLLACKDKLQYRVAEVPLQEIEPFIDKLLLEWIKMRKEEGGHLAKDLMERLRNLFLRLEKIEARQKKAPETFAERLRKRLEEAKILETLEDTRMMKEIILYSEKVDTTEEVVRLKFHFNQFEATLKSEEPAIGRKLDFLIQEMNREINSLGVKCQDLEIIKETLEIKAEIEKMREQVQNIE